MHDAAVKQVIYQRVYHEFVRMTDVHRNTHLTNNKGNLIHQSWTLIKPLLRIYLGKHR